MARRPSRGSARPELPGEPLRRSLRARAGRDRRRLARGIRRSHGAPQGYGRGDERHDETHVGTRAAPPHRPPHVEARGDGSKGGLGHRRHGGRRRDLRKGRASVGCRSRRKVARGARSRMVARVIAHATATIEASRDDVWAALVDPVAMTRYLPVSEVRSSWSEGASITWKGELGAKIVAVTGVITPF